MTVAIDNKQPNQVNTKSRHWVRCLATGCLAAASMTLFTASRSAHADESGETDKPQAADHVKEQGLMKLTEIEGISEYQLDNGLRVLLFPDDSKEVVTVNMTIFVGSRHEGYGEAGMAHLLEHMLFKGTPEHPEIPKLLTDRGARFNGTTWVDRTNYYETMPASDENLEFALRLEADRLVNSFIRGEDLESEMTVVRNEFEQGENSPISVMMERMQAAAYEWHNYGKATIGNRSDIERVPIVNLRRFYRKFYRPDNVMLVVAGKFDKDSALAHIKKYFGALQAPDVPIEQTYTVEPAQDGERTVVLRRVGEVQHVGAAYHVPASSHPDFAALKALVYVLGDEPSGRLYKEMIETKIASNVYTVAYSFAEPGLFMGIAEVPEETPIETARQELLEVMESSFADQPVTEAEVERAKQQILKQRELEASDSDRIAVSLSNWAAQGDWRLYFLYRDNIEKLTREAVQEAAERYFVRNNRTVGLFIPSEEAERVEIPESPDLAALFKDYKGREQIAAGEQFNPEPANIERRTERGELMPGIEYAMLPKKTRGETVSLMMTLRFGSGESLLGKRGAVEMLGPMLSRGTDKLSNQELQDELTRLRADLSTGSLTGLVQATVKTQRGSLPEVITLLGDVLRRPRLDASELEVLRGKQVSQLQQSLTDPQALAVNYITRALSPYGKDDIRYVRTLEEEIEMYESVTIEEIRSLHENFLSSQVGEIAVVGDFDVDEVKALLKTQLEGWKTDQKYQRVDQPPHPEIAGKLELIETPDKANAFFFSRQQYDLPDSDPAYASLVLGNFILGGGSLSSRLADRVRQKEGLSYGVASVLRSRAKDDAIDFMVYAITNPGNKDRLKQVIREEIDRLIADGVTEEELQKAKDGYLQKARVRRTTDSSIASELVGTIFTDRTMEHYVEHEQQIADATVESVNQAIRSYIKPDQLVTAIAGDFAKAAKEAKAAAGAEEAAGEPN